MENTSSETTSAAAATEGKAPAARRSRRATAATGEAVAAPKAAVETKTTEPKVAAAAKTAAATKTVVAAPETAETTATAPKKRAPRTRATKAASAPATDAAVSDAPTEAAAAQTAVSAAVSAPAVAAEPAVVATSEEAPKKRAPRSRKKAVAAEAAAVNESSPEAPAAAAPTQVAPEAVTESPGADNSAADVTAETAPPKKRQPRSRKKAADAEAAAPESPVAAATSPAEAAVEAPAEAAPATYEKPQRTRNRNGQNRRSNAQAAPESDTAHDDAAKTEDTAKAKTESKSAPAKSDESKPDSQSRSNRTRQRERKRRGQGDDFEVELNEDDVLLPIAGILDVLDNYAFVRTSGYLPGTNDVYVSLGQVKKYDLRKGDAVVGAIRQPRDSDGNGRQKYNAIVRVDSVNSRLTDEAQTRVEFAELTAVNPSASLKLETTSENLTGRLLDLFTPIGAGQRALVRGASGSGKTSLLRDIAAAVSANQPAAHLMFVALDARPEEITELQRTINGEVIGSSFDRPVEDHTTAAELAVERAKRLVELGHDVVVLLDTVTRLGRAFQQQHQSNSRAPQTGFDAAQLAPVKRLLAAARNVENGGSLTVIATANSGSVSQADELILEELETVWNAQIVLSSDLARMGEYPAIDIAASYTRQPAQLVGEDAVAALMPVRRAAVELSAVAASAAIREQMTQSHTNVEFLALAQRKQGL